MSSTSEGDCYICRCVSTQSVHNEKDHLMPFQLHSIFISINTNNIMRDRSKMNFQNCLIL